MDENAIEESDERRVGRRAVIKGAAAGAIGVWSVPVVSSFTSPAAAAGSGGNPNPECRGASCGNFLPCSSNPDCVCTTTSTGGGFCVPGSTSCGSLTACDANGGCPAGSLCAVNTCCGTPVCVPTALTCPPSTDGAKAATRASVPGTIGG